ncbi:MAG TPA: hypothetical protein VGF16_08770 [Bryobacteraceae bacterium]
MRRLLFLALMPALLAGDDHWVKYLSGPFELFTDAGGRSGRETLVRLEEFRWALGQMLGESDLQMPVPVRVFVLKNAKGWTTDKPVSEGRATYNIVLDEKSVPGPPIYTELTRLFLSANTGRMPATYEHGLLEFFSTFQVTGIRITAGAPPPQPDLDWARIHLLVVDPQYFGKLRVLLYNLRKGVADDAAYRNAFDKSPADVEAQAKQHLASGQFQTTSLPNRALSAQDFQERQVSDADARLARADLLAGSQSAAEYQALVRDQANVAEAEEGLGLLAIRDHNQDEARKHFTACGQAGSKSARCYIEYAKLEPDNDKANQALLRAAGINSKLDEPFALMAARDTDPAKRLGHWKAAAERNPRNAAYWQALAEAYIDQKDFSDAAKAWTQGEQAATDPAVRERMRQARMAIEQQRLDYEAAERQKEADELEKLKQQARADVHALEEKYKDSSGAKPVPWWDGPKPSGKLSGSLKQVDCLGKQARLVIEGSDHKLTRLLVPDAKQVVILGGGDQALGCGAQKPRPVTVEYFPKTNPRLSTAGEVATINFQ